MANRKLNLEERVKSSEVVTMSIAEPGSRRAPEL
jgi:hypothetical protein